LNELSAINYAPPAVVKANGDNYEVTIPNSGTTIELMRETDFGVIPGTKKPCLFKSGAERIVMGYGISTSFTVEKAIEEFEGDTPYFYFRVKCSFDKAVDGRLIHITDGYGCANSNEKACGHAGKFDLANARLKIAKKRALVDGALLIGQLSNMFAQDIENEDFIEKGEKKLAERLDSEAPITVNQRKRIYAIAAQNGFSQIAAKKAITDAGFASTTEIKQKDYDAVCALFEKGKAE